MSFSARRICHSWPLVLDRLRILGSEGPSDPVPPSDDQVGIFWHQSRDRTVSHWISFRKVHVPGEDRRRALVTEDGGDGCMTREFPLVRGGLTVTRRIRKRLERTSVVSYFDWWQKDLESKGPRTWVRERHHKKVGDKREEILGIIIHQEIQGQELDEGRVSEGPARISVWATGHGARWRDTDPTETGRVGKCCRFRFRTSKKVRVRSVVGCRKDLGRVSLYERRTKGVMKYHLK